MTSVFLIHYINSYDNGLVKRFYFISLWMFLYMNSIIFFAHCSVAGLVGHTLTKDHLKLGFVINVTRTVIKFNKT